MFHHLAWYLLLSVVYCHVIFYVDCFELPCYHIIAVITEVLSAYPACPYRMVILCRLRNKLWLCCIGSHSGGGVGVHCNQCSFSSLLGRWTAAKPCSWCMSVLCIAYRMSSLLWHSKLKCWNVIDRNCVMWRKQSLLSLTFNHWHAYYCSLLCTRQTAHHVDSFIQCFDTDEWWYPVSIKVCFSHLGDFFLWAHMMSYPTLCSSSNEVWLNECRVFICVSCSWCFLKKVYRPVYLWTLYSFCNKCHRCLNMTDSLKKFFVMICCLNVWFT